MTPTLILSKVLRSLTFNSRHCDSKIQTLIPKIQFQKIIKRFQSLIKNQLKQSQSKLNPPFLSLQAITASAVSKGVTKPSHME
jgi:hypothetical protein